MPAFLARTAFAAPDAAKPGAKDTILVVVQLTGGNDGLNTVIPFADAEYAKLRPTIAVPKDQVKKIDDSSACTRPWATWRGCSKTDALCVVHGVGYPNPSQSHFRSMDIWQGGSHRREHHRGLGRQGPQGHELPGLPRGRRQREPRWPWPAARPASRPFRPSTTSS